MNDMAVRLDPRDPTLRLRAAEDRVIREFLECGGRRVRITRSGDVNTCDPRDERDRGAGPAGEVLLSERFMRAHGHVMEPDRDKGFELLLTEEGGQCGER